MHPAVYRSERHIGFCRAIFDCLKESSGLPSDGMLSWKKLATLEHRKPMDVEIVEWVLRLICDACNVRCVTEGNSHQYIKCAKVDRCPFNIGKETGKVVVFGVHLFEKIALSKDQKSMQTAIDRIIGPGFKDRQFGLFIQGSQKHFTTGVIHLPKCDVQAGNSSIIRDDTDRRPSVSWRCSMGWPLDSTIRSQLSTFVKELLMGQEPVVHVKKVAYQRKQECAPRSMLDLFDILMHIARGVLMIPTALSVIAIATPRGSEFKSMTTATRSGRS